MFPVQYKRLHQEMLTAHGSVPCSVYERAYRSLRETQPDAKEEAVMLLEAWKATEAAAESETARAVGVEAVEKRMPKRIKRKVSVL